MSSYLREATFKQMFCLYFEKFNEAILLVIVLKSFVGEQGQ